MPYAYRDSGLVARARKWDLSQHDSVEIVSMGDLHTGDAHCEWSMIRGAVDWLKEEPNRYAIIPGDLFNTAMIGSVSLDLSEPPMPTMEARHLLARILEPVRDRVLAIVPGNHDDRLTKSTGEDSVDALACELALPYFPEGEAFLELSVGHYEHNGSPIKYRGLVVHGTAGGRLPGGKANALLNMRRIVHNCDFYLNGHGHTPMLIPEVAWAFDSYGNVREQQQWFISCGSSLKRGGYPVKKSFPPLARVFPTLTLHGGSKHMTAQAG